MTLAPRHEIRAPQAATENLTWVGTGYGQTSQWCVDDAILYQYYANVVTFASIRAIAQDIASLDFRAGSDPDEPENFDKSAPLAQLLGPEPGSPNPEMSAAELWHYTVASWYLGGFYAWELELVRGKKDVAAIWPLVSKCVKPIPSQTPGRYFDGIEYTVRNTKVTYNNDNSVYDWNKSQDDIRQAETPLIPAQLAISVMAMQDTYDYAFLRNDARPAAVIVHEGFSVRAERDAWRERFMMDHQGPENAGKIHWVETSEGGATPKDAFDVKQLGLSQADAEFIARYNQKLRDVVMAFGVPMSRLGDSSERTFSNADKEYEIYRKNVLAPLAKRLASGINRKLAPKIGKEVGWFDLTPFEVMEANNRIVTIGIPELLKHKVIKFNEGRMAIGLKPVDGGDRFITDEELALFQQGAAALIAQAAPIQRTEKNPEELEVGKEIEPPPTPEPVQPASNAGGTAAADAPPQDGAGPVPKEQRSRGPLLEQRSIKAYKKFDKRVRGHEATFESKLQEVFDKQLKITLSRLEGKRGRKYLAETRASVADTSQVFDHEFWQQETAQALLTQYGDIYVDAVGDLIAQLDIAFDVSDPHAQDFINARANQLAWNVTDTTYKDIQAQLAEGAANGESIPTISDRIKNLFAQTYKNRAKTVARTEVISAYNGSAHDKITNTPDDGIVMMEWLATPGTRTRHTHREANGQRVPPNSMFTVGGHAMAYPGDPSGPAREVVNCRCTLLLLTPEELGQTRSKSEQRSNPVGYNQYKHMTGGGEVPSHVAAREAFAATPEGHVKDKPGDLGSPEADTIYGTIIGDSSPEMRALESAANARRADWASNGTDEQKLAAEVAGKWTHTSNDRRKEILSNDKEMIKRVGEVTTRNDVDLYRGVALGGSSKKKKTVSAAIHALKPGDTLPDFSLASFSESAAHARTFTRGSERDQEVMFKIKPGGARALSLSEVSRSPAEQEWVTSGKFKVTGFSEHVMNATTRGGVVKQYATKIIEIEQI